MPTTAICGQLGIEHPILSVGFAAAAGPELAAAVSNAGGLGVVGASGMPPDFLIWGRNRETGSAGADPVSRQDP